MRALLKSQISPQAFAECWTKFVAPYELFLDTASEKLSSEVTPPVTNFTCLIRSSGENRVRLDGHFSDASGDKTYYLELVWLPRFSSYRGGRSSVYDAIPAAAPKSVQQFIAALNAITGEEEIIFEGQVFNAIEGVDESAAEIDQAFPAIFDLFERFPDTDFGSPGVLVHLLEARGGYKDLLADSIRRQPSIPAVTMVNRLLNSSTSDDERTRWLESLRAISDSNSAPDGVKYYTKEFLAYQASRTDLGANP